jgi:predicted Rossmann fold flavoprotein
MIGYVTLGTNDLPRAAAFYDTLLAEIGAKRLMEFPTGIAWGVSMQQCSLALMKPYDGKPATVGNGVMAAIVVDSKDKVDRVVIGAGAAGLFCAGVAGQSGLKVLLVDHTDKIAEKIRISGGGRCNFTNLLTSPTNFLGDNPKFCRSALAGYPPGDFIDLIRRHEIGYHEKHKGQLFCDNSAQDLITMLLTECGVGGVTHWQNCPVHTIATSESEYGYLLGSAQGAIQCRAVVIATGGLSIPKIGASDFGYRIARQFDLPLVPTRPALVPLVFDAAQWAPFAQLSGLSLPVAIETGNKRERTRFLEDLLFTHRGLSGPAVLQISSYWNAGTPIRLDLAPDTSMLQTLLRAKGLSRKLIANELAALGARRLADTWVAQGRPHWGTTGTAPSTRPRTRP